MHTSGCDICPNKGIKGVAVHIIELKRVVIGKKRTQAGVNALIRALGDGVALR